VVQNKPFFPYKKAIMAKFRLYNVQLLPKTVDESDEGSSGYKRLLARLREATKEAKRNKDFPNFHIKMGRDTHFGPYEFHVSSHFVWGYFIRYTRTNKVDEVHTMQALYKEQHGKVGVSGVKEILFIFDCKQHFLAIEEAGNSIPKPTELIQVLDNYLRPHAEEEFPKHNLHVLLMSDTKSLDAVFENAVAYSRIDVELTFPNGPAEDTLEEVKRARLQKLNIVGAAGGGEARISKDLPHFLTDLIKASLRYGKAQLSYFIKNPDGKGGTKKVTYSSEATPMTFEKRQSANETDEHFALRCGEELAASVDDLQSRVKTDTEEGNNAI
jgi:hypothetical protein